MKRVVETSFTLATSGGAANHPEGNAPAIIEAMLAAGRPSPRRTQPDEIRVLVAGTQMVTCSVSKFEIVELTASTDTGRTKPIR